MARLRCDNPTMPMTEACRKLGMGRMFLSDLMRKGDMTDIGFAVKKGNRWRYVIYREKVEDFVKARYKQKEDLSEFLPERKGKASVG